MKNRAGSFLLFVAAIALLGLGGPDSPPLRDGRFGLSGIAQDKSALAGLPIDVARTGFYIGPSAGFVGSNKERMCTHRMRDLVSYGITPIANVYVGDVDETNGAALSEIVSYYTAGEGASAVGAPVVYWELGNEENGGWGTSCPPEEFARRTGILAAGIRAACPGCRIIMGGLLDGPEMGEWRLADYLDRFLDAGGGDSIDIYAFHYYGLARPSARLPAAQLYDSAIEIVDGMRRVLTGHGIEDPSIWVTETSTFSGGMGEIKQSESDEAADLVKRYVLLWELGIEKVLWTYLIEPRYEGTGVGFFDQSGLIYDGFGPYDRGEGVKKKSYFAYAHLIDRLRGASLTGFTRDGGATLVRFDTPEGEIQVLWQDPWVENGPVWIESPGKVTVTVEDIVGNVLAVREGTFRLDLGLEPVYLIGEVTSLRTSPPELRSTDGS